MKWDSLNPVIFTFTFLVTGLRCCRDVALSPPCAKLTIQLFTNEGGDVGWAPFTVLLERAPW